MEHLVTNEKKARELAIKATKDVDENGNEVYNVFCEAALQEMAAWKDQQFKQEKKEMLGLIKLLKIDETNQTIIEDLIAYVE